MESNVKQKKRLKKPPKEASTKIQTIVSSPIPTTPLSDIRESAKKLSKSAHRCQSPVPKERGNFSPKTSNRATSAQFERPKIITRGDVGSSSMNRLCSKPCPKESLTKGNKKIEKLPKNVLKEKLPTQTKKFLEKPESRPLSPKKPTSKTNITIYTNKPQTKPNKRLKELLTSCSCKDIMSLRQDCHRIEIVFQNRKKKDKTSRMDNLNMLGKIHLLITYGGLEECKPREHIIRYITSYLCNNTYLLSQLVYIMADAEDLRTCLCTLKLLYQLLIKDCTIDENERAAVKTALGSSSILGTLIESMNLIHKRFLGSTGYKEELQKVHFHILQMIIAVCRTKSNRKQFRRASEGTVKLIGRLVSTCNGKDLANYLLEAVKIICINKENCIILASKKFFDGLCTCYDLTRKLFTVPIILKVMSREKSVLNCMSGNEKIVSLIVEMVCYSGKKLIHKQALLTTLYRVTRESNGLKILSKNEMFYKLFHYFRKNEKSKLIQHRLGTIKTYSILNRAVNQIILPTIQLNRNLCLPENVKKCLEEENVSDESESENDESEEDSEDDDDSDDVDASITTINSLKKSTISHTQQYETNLEDMLTAMSPFYVECLLTSDETDYKSIFKFDIYEGILSLSNRKIIENRVQRGLNNDRHAYPDAVMLEPELDDHVLNPLINNFSIESLSYKLKCSKGIQHHSFVSQVIYDLDELHGSRKQPIELPHPSTFVPSRNRNQANILSSLKFESRFECGNLRKAIQIERYEYELLLTPDTSTSKGLQWFYFQVSNMVPGITYTFSIANFLKFNSQHNYGMQPLMFSVIDYAIYKRGWKRVGEEIIYYGNNYTDESGDKQYRTLLFSVTFPYPNDYVYFAYHYPYTYTRLMIKLYPFVNYKMNEIYARIDKLCNTVKTRNEIALLTITGAWNRANTLGIPLRRRPIIFITARVHPGETNASWIMEGIINFLLDQTDPNAVIAREHFIFKIIPMLNPEGVIYGNTRNGLTGSDLNRCWAKPNKITCPEIYYAKRLIACARKQLKLPVAAYIDIHGHSRKKYFFFYGCNPKMSWNKKDKANGNLIETLKILPDMVHEMNPNIRLTQCKYKITKNRESTGRVVMWREFDIKHSYTLECSYSFASDKQSVNTKILSEIGASVIASLGKLADKAYTSRKTIPSLALDYTFVSNFRAADKRPVENRLKEGADGATTFPLFICSRAFPLDAISNKSP